jgi:spore germination protein
MVQKALYILFFLFIASPASVFAADLEFSGWIPYWKAEKGVESILPHISEFTEVNPFLYTVKSDGTLFQADKITDTEWVELIAQAQLQNVRFIPTVMWSNGEAIHGILSDPVKRKAHITSIMQQVYRYGYDGIDIDYEAKLAETNPYFTLFLKELYEAIGSNKWIMCTIEPRMPLESRYANPEEKIYDLAYANDFDAINTYCDRVRVMAYDQGRADVLMNKAKADPYVPVADPEWVERVVNYMMEDIDPQKIMIGVPTYGYEYDMSPRAEGSTSMLYSRLWSFSHNYAVDVAQKLGLEIAQVNGEAQLVFPATQSPEPELPRPDATRVLVWSDARSIQEKIELAEKLGIRGVSIFKIDGGEDPALWNVLAQYDSAVGAQKSVDVALVRGTIDMSTPTGEKAVTLVMPTTDLEYGMRNENVRILQRFLNNNGLLIAGSGPGSKGNETNFFGPATKNALARFQELHGIKPASGYYGPKTRAKIAGLGL